MSQSRLAGRQNPYGLLLFESLLHILAIGFLFLHLPDPLAQRSHYLVLSMLGVAVLLRIATALAASNDSSITGNFGQSTTLAQIGASSLLGLSWGVMLPLLSSWEISAPGLQAVIPIGCASAGIVLFAGSAFNSQLLLAYLLPGFGVPLIWLFTTARVEEAPLWGVLALALLALTRAGAGLQDLIERFLQISRGNTELVKNLARTRDQAVAAQKSAERAREAIQQEVIEREKAEAKIKASERELSRILDDMMDTYFQVAPSGALRRISPSVQWTLGYSAEQAQQKSWQDLFADADGHARFLDALERSFGTLNDYEARLQHREGEPVWVTLNAHYRENAQGLRDGFEGIARNTTEARNAREKLFQEKELWRVTLQSIADGVITTDINGKVSFINPVAERMSGWSNDEARQRPLAEVMQLVDEGTKQPIEIPIQEWLTSGQETELANPAVLIQKGRGGEASIELAGSPIRDSAQNIIGSVMVFHDVTRLRTLAMQLSHQATHDGLTGLLNRVAFDARVEQAIRSANQSEKQHALLYIDLDQFKIVNDTCGHPAGDELLIQVTRLLRGSLRESDVLARLGGDEFGVLLLGCPLDKAETIAEKLRQQVEEFRFPHGGTLFRIGASIGVVPILDAETPLTDLMKAVDSACYVAKEKGRNLVHVSRPADKDIARQHGQMQWMQRIQRALEEDEFILYSQAISRSDPAGSSAGHLELLLRMVENKGTENERIIPPSAFLPAAERYHLMPSIDRWVLDRAIRTLADPSSTLAEVATCSINLSGQSLTDLKVYDYIHQLLKKTSIDPHRLCFEITESSMIANMDVAQQFVSGLRKLGCRFALDDFGSGLSTFDYLKQLEVDYVKLDGSLVRDVATSRVSQAMVHAVNYVVHVMGMESIAEFVESDAIIATVRKLSVDYLQGYAIGRPEPID
jgi:diguanylate cyclase (GGDEF)-like protein/PAS domain S-box-containing protein